MKHYEKYLKQIEARAIYECLKSIHFRIGDYMDKANSLRTIFDATLQTICNRKHGGQKPNDIDGFVMTIMNIFDNAESNGKDLSKRLNKSRTYFNKKVQHRLKATSNGELVLNEPINEYEYKFCLSCVAELVCFFSGVAIPSYLHDACYRHTDVSMKRKLEMVIVLQLFDTLGNVDKGILVYDSLRRMISRKNSYGFNKLEVKVVVYNPALCMMAENGSVLPSPVNEAVREGLDRLDEAIGRWMEDREDCTDRPWFLWLCHTLDEEVDKKLVERLGRLIDANMTSFYPVNMGSTDVKEKFLGIWPGCGPISMNPELADNFFNTSLLLSVQRMQQKT